MKSRFTKVEGIGNDFVLFDATSGPLPALDTAKARALCDRHRGIGADGVLVLSPSERADAFFAIWNADGSRSEMCGNGLRCAAVQLGRTREATELTIESAAGLHHCRPTDGGAYIELVGLKLSPTEHLALDARSARPSVEGRRVSLGNPHFVVQGVDLAEAAQLGPLLENHPRFAPARTNVEFCAVQGQTLTVRVWERGVGLTQACGTGAAAAVAAAWEDGALARANTWVQLPGGTLEVAPLAADRLGLTGPARAVFEGEVDL